MKTVFAVNNTIWIFLAIVAFFALVAIIAFVIHRVLHPKLKDDPNKPTSEQIAKEEMDRLLVEVDDEETAKAISEYKEKDEE